MQDYRTSPLLVPIALALGLTAIDAGAQDIKDRAIRLANVVPKENAIGQGVTRFAEIVSQKSGDKMKVRGFDNGQLGGELQTLSSAQGGVLEMLIVSTAASASTVREFALFDFPFLFADEKEADAVLDGPVGTQLLEKLPEKGIVGLCYWEYGFRHTTNSKLPIAKLDDFRGLKIRTVQNPVYIDVFNALGANATPLPFPEVYAALDSRAVDGAEGPYTTLYTSKFYEVQKFLSDTKHIYTTGIVAAGKKFWDQLSGDEKRILQDSCAEAREYERKVSRDGDLKIRAELKAKGHGGQRHFTGRADEDA
jgi:tripartite ATP-independent transporter DctP family solute receptor